MLLFHMDLFLSVVFLLVAGLALTSRVQWTVSMLAVEGAPVARVLERLTHFEQWHDLSW